MANPVWPETLPCPSIADCRYAPLAPDVITTSVQGGTPKVRSASTATPEVLSFTLLVHAQEYITLRNFREVTLKKVGVFDWKDWRTMNPRSYYFQSQPQYTFQSGSRGLWAASINLVTVP